MGNKNNYKKIQDEISKNPLTYNGKPFKKKVTEKWLGDKFSEDGLSASITETITSRKGRVTAASFEVKALLEDLRMMRLGGIMGALQIWEMAIIPMLMNNSETWTDIKSDHIEALENMQTLFLSMILCVPNSCPRVALCWDTGTNKMSTRIIKKKLTFSNHLKNLSDDSLAKQIFREQKENKWPGLISEAKLLCNELFIPDITEPHNRFSTNMWKNEVTKAADERDERYMKEEMVNLSKVEVMKEERFGTKQYLKEMTMQQARMQFRIRTCMTKCKMNFSNDMRNKATLWRCESCETCIDTQQHVLFCPAYKSLREGKSLENDKDIVDYFIQVMRLRSKLDLTR